MLAVLLSLYFALGAGAADTSCGPRYSTLREMNETDAAIFDATFRSEASSEVRAARLLADLQKLQGQTIGAHVDVFEHSLQTAERAYAAGEDEEIVVAALLHDIGEVDIPVAHGEIAAALLRPHVSPDTTWLLEHHEVFQFAHYAHGTRP